MGANNKSWFTFILLLLFSSGAFPQPVIKVGVLGAMSGPAKYWGLTNKYCALATAEMYNTQGGINIDGQRYRIEVVSVDTKMDPQTAVMGAKQLLRNENIKYIIGPNIDDTAHAIIPLLEANDSINITYGFNSSLYQPPRKNSFLGMIHPTQTAPTIYQFLMKHYNIQSIAFFARQDQEALVQRNYGITAAQQLGLEIKDIDAWDISDTTYTSALTRLKELAKSYSLLNPDLLVLSGVTPSDATKIISALREQGFKGFIGTETAHDPKQLLKLGNKLGNFVTLGSSPPESTYTPYMKRFKETYIKIAGEWHDEAGVKAYALETILRILQKAGKDAITDTRIFRKSAEKFEIPDPFSNTGRKLVLIGDNIFNQKKQINVPFIINVIQNGKLNSLIL